MKEQTYPIDVMIEPIAVRVIIAHIMKLYIIVPIPTTKRTNQTITGLDLGRKGPYLKMIVMTEVMMVMLMRHIKSHTSHITLGCIPIACIISEF